MRASRHVGAACLLVEFATATFRTSITRPLPSGRSTAFQPRMILALQSYALSTSFAAKLLPCCLAVSTLISGNISFCRRALSTRQSGMRQLQLEICLRTRSPVIAPDASKAIRSACNSAIGAIMASRSGSTTKLSLPWHTGRNATSRSMPSY